MSSSESEQHRKGRNRPPRMRVTVDVHADGASEGKEIPFVMGVIGDLHGQTEPEKKFKDRRFAAIDRESFDKVLAGMEPSLRFRVADRLSKKDGAHQLNVELNFRSLEDFGPDRVAKQVPALAKLLEARQQLSDLRNKMAGNEKLEELLQDIIENTDRREALVASVRNKPPGEGSEG
jgi:type VI secretion system protein ImpB